MAIRLRAPLAIAAMLARFHGNAVRGQSVDAEATVGAISARWHENLAELKRYVDTSHFGCVTQRDNEAG